MSTGKLSRRELIALTPRSPADPSEIVHIASLLVQVTPKGMAVAKLAAEGMPGAEIHDTASPSKFVVVLESSREREIADAAEHLLRVSGVVTVSIVAHWMESAADLQREA